MTTAQIHAALADVLKPHVGEVKTDYLTYYLAPVVARMVAGAWAEGYRHGFASEFDSARSLSDNPYRTGTP